MVEFTDVREAENAVALLYFRSSGALIFTGRIWGMTTLRCGRQMEEETVFQGLCLGAINTVLLPDPGQERGPREQFC